MQADRDSPELPLTITGSYQHLDSPYLVQQNRDSALLKSIVGHFKSEVQSAGTTAININDLDQYKEAANVSKYILDIALQDMAKYEFNLLVAAEFRYCQLNLDSIVCKLLI